MPKGEAARVNRESQQLHRENQANQRAMYNFFMPSMQNAYSQSQDMFNDIYGRYRNLFNQPDPTKPGFLEFSRTGGWSPEDRAGMMGDITGLEDYARNPISAGDMARYRGGGVYDEFAKTGGYSTQDLQNIRSRSNASIPSFFQSLRDELDTRARVQGGLPGYSGQMAKMARDQAQASALQALGTETDIKKAVNEGRQWGAQGMTSSEASLQDLIQRAKLGGYGTAGNLRTGMMNSINQGRLSGLAGLGNTQDRRLQMLAGMQNLYQATPGQVQMLIQGLMQTQGMTQQEATNYIGQQMQYNPNRGFMDTFRDIAGIALPFVSPFLGGGGASRNSGGGGGGSTSPFYGTGYGYQGNTSMPNTVLHW